MEGYTMARNKYFKEAAINAGLDVEKDFFSLSCSEVSKVDEIRRMFKYSGRNYIGRSPARQFWYAIQRAK